MPQGAARRNQIVDVLLIRNQAREGLQSPWFPGDWNVNAITFDSRGPTLTV
jgi:hypothetical protein